MTRSEIQSVVLNGLRDALREAGVDMNRDHRRRLLRALLRISSRLALEHEVPVPIFSAMTLQALVEEAETKRPACLEARPVSLEELN